jgi:peptidoglycan/xylan/chitin deacetylase (PgdA/CDA1 family)
MEWLAGSHVKVVPLEQIASEKTKRDLIAITFDDGYRNFADVALPILQSLGLASTVFVISGRTGESNVWDAHNGGIPSLRLMDWTAIEDCQSAGVTIGSHGRTHRALERLSAAEIAEEIEGSADDIAGRTGVVPQTFAYPFGRFDDAACLSAKKTYAVACTTEMRELSRRDRLHEIPRVDAWYLRTPGILERLGTPRFGAWLRLRNAARHARAAWTNR